CLMHLPQPVLENFPKPDQDGQGDAAQLEIVDQLLQVEAAVEVLVGVNPDVAVRANREIALAPAGNIVELPGFSGGPTVSRFPDRCGIGHFHSSHEFSVSLVLTRRASEK